MKTKKKVLHFIESGGLYGAERVILNLSQEMVSHGNYEPVIGCIVPKEDATNELYDKAMELGFPAVKIVIVNHLLPIHLLKAARTIINQHIDLIHCHGYKAFVFAFIIGRILRLKVLSTCHLWFLKGRPPFKMLAMIRIELFLYRFIPKVISVSQAIRDVLMQAGISASKIMTIPNGVRIEDYQDIEPLTTKRLKTELGIGPDDKVVLNVGRLTLQKSQKNILEAARILCDTGHKIRFLIVGEGELRRDLEGAIAGQELANHVSLLGFRHDIKELLSIADLFVLVSIDEGMPMSLIEAVASRTPVISTMVGDIPKLIQHGTSGYAIPKEDPRALTKAILWLVKTPLEGVRFAAKALEALQGGFSSSAMYKDYDRVYRMLLESTPTLKSVKE